MSIWQQLLTPWQKLRRKNNHKNSQDYQDNNNDGGITQSTTVTTTTNPDSKNAVPKNNKKIQIITDDPAEEDALYFQSYSENLANIIREAKPKFVVGIFGKWGTVKTTL